MIDAVRVLVVEDDCEINNQLSQLLSERGYQVDQAFDGESALQHAALTTYQLVLLDITLPKRDGLSVMKTLRADSSVPVIMVSAKGAEEERIQGLSSGADDYIAKPFNSMELVLRIEAVLRRCSPTDSMDSVEELAIEGLRLFKREGRARIQDRHVDLTPIQFKLLWTLLSSKGEILSKASLYQTVLNRPMGAYDRSLDMHLSRVRKKLTAAGWQGDRLETIHGKGYCFA